MDEKLREILREHRYSYDGDDLVAFCSCGAKIQVSPFIDQWIAHIEQLERAQPATPLGLCDYSHGYRTPPGFKPHEKRNDCVNWRPVPVRDEQPSVAAQGTDELQEASVLTECGHPITHTCGPECESISALRRDSAAELARKICDHRETETLAEMVERSVALIRAHDAALIARTREETLKLREALQAVMKHVYCENDYTARQYEDYYAALELAKIALSLSHTEKATQSVRPKIICLCGSTRFIEQFAIKTWELEFEGYIVLGCTLLPSWYCPVRDHFAESLGVKEQIDNHHLRKIDLADEVLVLNVGGYIGSSARSEIDYATAHGKPVRYLEAQQTEGKQP